MRFAVIGNCQSRIFADCLSLFFPGAEVVRYGSDRRETAEGAAEIAAGLGGFDRVFSHPEMGERMGPLRHAALRETHPGTVFFPSIAFNGFQPDCIYLSDSRGGLGSPIDVYHSAIAAAAFTLGLDEARTAALYNALVFARLGYFEDHARATGALVAHCRRMGLEVADRLPLWQRNAAFMFTINHPRARVMADLAWLVLRRIGIEVPELGDVSDVLGEPLARMPVFPVYPEIGRRLGLPGHRFFRDAIRGDGLLDLMDLPAFVTRSFALYRTMPGRVAEAVERHPRAKPVAEALAAMLPAG